MTVSQFGSLKSRITNGEDVLLDLANYSVVELSAVILGLMQHSDSRYWYATCLLRDLLLLEGAKSPQIAVRFRESYDRGEQWQIMRVLDQGLLSTVANVRRWSIYTLGKLGAHASLPCLRESLLIAIDRDPLMISTLLFEMEWLGLSTAEFRAMAERLVSADWFVHRWIAVAVIRDSSQPEACYDLLERLKRDPHPYVRREAVGGTCPFDRMERAFLAARGGRPDYTVPELVNFVHTWQA